MKNANGVITIDGPAASGKTSVSRDLAQLFGWPWVSTGSFYRGLALVAVKEGVDLGHVPALVSLANSDIWAVQMTPQETVVLYKGQRLNDELVREENGMNASRISQYPEVRSALLPLQRKCAEMGSVLVAAGRDCGTVVFPQALLKVYLTASSESRAFRRSLEQEDTNLDSLLDLQKKRDREDKQRTHAPLQIPQGALVIDSSQLQKDEVVSQIAKQVRVLLGIPAK